MSSSMLVFVAIALLPLGGCLLPFPGNAPGATLNEAEPMGAGAPEPSGPSTRPWALPRSASHRGRCLETAAGSRREATERWRRTRAWIWT